MATLDDVISRIQNLVNSSVNVSLTTGKVEPSVQLRYEELYEEHIWRSRLTDFVIPLVAQVSSDDDDVVDVTEGDATVTSDGTPFAASMVGRQIEIGGDEQYYFIASFTATSSIELGTGESASTTWAASSASSTDWRIFQTLYTLPSDCDEVIALATDTPLTEGSGGRIWIDQRDSVRQATADPPSHWIYAGENASGVPEIEVWPVPTASRLIRGQYTKAYTSLTSTATINVNVPVLVYAATADVLHTLSATVGPQESNIEQMALFYERKSIEKLRDIKPKEIAKLSPVKRLGRRASGRRSLRGTDYEATHQIF